MRIICQGRCCPAVTPVLCFYFLITYVLLEIVPWQVVFAGWLHFSEVLVCTAQRPAHSVQVPGRDLNARTSSFNLSYHQRTPGPSPVCALCSPLTRNAARCLAQLNAARAGCGRDGEFDISILSSALKSGTLVRPAWEVDAARKPHSFRRPRAVTSSRTVDLCMRASGGVVSVLSTCRVGDHNSLWQCFLVFPTSSRVSGAWYQT